MPKKYSIPFLFARVFTAASALAVCASPTVFAQSETRSGVRPDALLQIDLNRTAVIERIVSSWESEVPSAQINSLKSKLMGLRADQLLAANVSGWFDGVLEVLNRNEAALPLTVEQSIRGFTDGDRVSFENASIADRSKAVGEPDRDLVYTPIVPCNVMDTRPGTTPVPPEGGPALAAGYAVRNVQITGRCGIPAGAKAVTASYTVENIPSTGGVLFAADAGGTGGAVVSWSAPANYATGASITPLSVAGAIQLQSAGVTQVKLDLVGYFRPPSRNGNGLRVVFAAGFSDSPNIANGSLDNRAGTPAAIAGAPYVAGGGTPTSPGATVSGGGSGASNCYEPATDNNIRFCGNQATATYSVVAGGQANLVSGAYGTVSGGSSNTASAQGSTISGGDFHTASGAGSAIGGGLDNSASGNSSTVAGGTANGVSGLYGSIGGGLSNRASGYAAAIGGGTFNFATGTNSTIAGGADNFASGQYSFAAGRRAEARNDGQLVWSDAQPFSFDPQTQAAFGAGVSLANTFSVRATGGVWLATGIDTLGNVTSSCRINPGTSAWSCSSDKRIKERVEAVSPISVLNSLMRLSISKWSIIGSPTRQIGPMAQDFYRQFRVGASDTHINTIDAQGVAFAAIQGLGQKQAMDAKIKDEKIALQGAEIASLKRELNAIKKKLGL